MAYNIAIVEDDIDQQQNYAEALSRKGFTPYCYSNVESALAGIAEVKPDIVLLDVVLEDDPDGGFTICRRLLDQGANLPIVFLTDRSDEIDQVFGLRLGAWDYQTKPISLSLLAERVKSVLRIHSARQNLAAPFNSASNFASNVASSPNKFNSIDQGVNNEQSQLHSQLQIQLETSFVAWKGQTVPLTLTEFRLFVAIHDAGAQGINYQTLSESTMQRMVTNGTINSHIKNLRKKFNEIDPNFNAVLNKPGFGYRWETP